YSWLSLGRRSCLSTGTVEPVSQSWSKWAYFFSPSSSFIPRNQRSAVPPRTACSHSSSLGKRQPHHAANTHASYQLTFTTGQRSSPGPPRRVSGCGRSSGLSSQNFQRYFLWPGSNSSYISLVTGHWCSAKSSTSLLSPGLGGFERWSAPQ